MADAAHRASPLAAMSAELDSGSAEGVVRLRELSFQTMVNLRGDARREEFVRAARKALGMQPPKSAGTVTKGKDCVLLWLGPDEWLVVAGEGMQRDIVERLGKALQDQHAAITDVSANRTVLELSGPKARDVLAKGCHLDLHPAVFSAGQCAGTLLAKAQVFLQQIDETPTYRLYVARSFSVYVASWLLDAMSEFVFR